jgi:hypothetical protein
MSTYDDKLQHPAVAFSASRDVYHQNNPGVWVKIQYSIAGCAKVPGDDKHFSGTIRSYFRIINDLPFNNVIHFKFDYRNCEGKVVTNAVSYSLAEKKTIEREFDRFYGTEIVRGPYDVTFNDNRILQPNNTGSNRSSASADDEVEKELDKKLNQDRLKLNDGKKDININPRPAGGINAPGGVRGENYTPKPDLLATTNAGGANSTSNIQTQIAAINQQSESTAKMVDAVAAGATAIGSLLLNNNSSKSYGISKELEAEITTRQNLIRERDRSSFFTLQMKYLSITRSIKEAAKNLLTATNLLANQALLSELAIYSTYADCKFQNAQEINGFHPASHYSRYFFIKSDFSIDLARNAAKEDDAYSKQNKHERQNEGLFTSLIREANWKAVGDMCYSTRNKSKSSEVTDNTFSEGGLSGEAASYEKYLGLANNFMITSERSLIVELGSEAGDIIARKLFNNLPVAREIAFDIIRRDSSRIDLLISKTEGVNKWETLRIFDQRFGDGHATRSIDKVCRIMRAYQILGLTSENLSQKTAFYETAMRLFERFCQRILKNDKVLPEQQYLMMLSELYNDYFDVYNATTNAAEKELLLSKLSDLFERATYLN